MFHFSSLFCWFVPNFKVLQYMNFIKRRILLFSANHCIKHYYNMYIYINANINGVVYYSSPVIVIHHIYMLLWVSEQLTFEFLDKFLDKLNSSPCFCSSLRTNPFPPPSCQVVIDPYISPFTMPTLDAIDPADLDARACCSWCVFTPWDNMINTIAYKLW